MNLRDEQKKNIRENLTTRFMDILDYDSNHWYPQYWKSAADEFIRRLLRHKPIEEYLNEVFAMLNELMVWDQTNSLAFTVFGFWCSKVEADIVKIVEAKQQAEFKAKSGKAIFERHRKTTKRELHKYVKAFHIMKEFLEYSDYAKRDRIGFAGYLENNDGVYNLPGFNKLGKMLRDILVNNPKLAIELKTPEDLDDDVRDIYGDFLEIRLIVTPSTAEPRKFLFQFSNDDNSLDMLIWDIESTIVHFAEKKFGEDGGLIAEMMIKGREPEDVKKENIQKPGRPQEVHLDRIILLLDDHKVDEVWIARFVNTLENRQRYKETRGGGEYRSRLGKYVPVAEPNMRKAIRMRIKKLGGNILRFELDGYIKWKKECRKCDWRYNEDGVVTRIPCKDHLDAPKEIGISKANRNWKQFLERRGLSYYANAITFK